METLLIDKKACLRMGSAGRNLDKIRKDAMRKLAITKCESIYA